MKLTKYVYELYLQNEHMYRYIYIHMEIWKMKMYFLVVPLRFHIVPQRISPYNGEQSLLNQLGIPHFHPVINHGSVYMGSSIATFDYTGLYIHQYSIIYIYIYTYI